MDIKNLKGIAKNVAKLLKQYPETRDNDKLLYLRYCEDFTNVDVDIDTDYAPWVRFKILFLTEFPHFESIRRVRAKIQSEGYYIGNTTMSRKIREQKMVQAMREPIIEKVYKEKVYNSEENNFLLFK